MNKRIFLLDDNCDYLYELRALLEETGYDVAVSDKPAQSLSSIRSFNPDVLILDLKMPLIDGRAFLPWLKKQFPHLAVIICTGDDRENSHNFLGLGVSGFVRKPISFQDFSRLIEQVFNDHSKIHKTI